MTVRYVTSVYFIQTDRRGEGIYFTIFIDVAITKLQPYFSESLWRPNIGTLYTSLFCLCFYKGGGICFDGQFKVDSNL